MMSDQKIFQSNLPKNQKIIPPKMPVSIGSGGAERNAGSLATSEVISADSHEIDLPNEIKEAGVEQIPNEGTIVEIPPDVKKMGVINSGATAPVNPSPSQAQFPIADDQLIKDSKGPVTSALTWLAIWCIKKLKKMHLALKSVSGTVERVQDHS